MLYSYNKYCLVLERNHIKKIKKFADVPEIYNWAHELDNHMSLWIADKFVKELKNDVVESQLARLDKYLKGSEKDPQIANLITAMKGRLRDDFTKILHYVNSPLHDNKPNINKLSLEEAIEKSEEWHKEVEKTAGKAIEDETGEVIMTFDDGFYWIDLQSTKCSDEAESMGHCGNTNEGTTILSLRDSKKQPHVTIAWNENDNIFTQIKGKGNNKPVERYHKYVVDLICDLKITRHKSEYQRTTDLTTDDLSEELLDKLKECNPDYIENSQPATIEELEKKYRADILNDIEYYAIHMYPDVFWDNLDDEEYVEDFKEGEKDYYISDFNSYFDSEQLRRWIENDDPDGLFEYLVEQDTDEGLDSDGEPKSLDELLDDCDIYDIYEHFDKVEEFVEEFTDKKFDNMSAKDIHEEFYGSNTEIDKSLFTHLERFLDEDGFADDIVRWADEDYLRETFDE